MSRNSETSSLTGSWVKLNQIGTTVGLNIASAATGPRDGTAENGDDTLSSPKSCLVDGNVCSNSGEPYLCGRRKKLPDPLPTKRKAKFFHKYIPFHENVRMSDIKVGLNIDSVKATREPEQEPSQLCKDQDKQLNIDEPLLAMPENENLFSPDSGITEETGPMAHKLGDSMYSNYSITPSINSVNSHNSDTLITDESIILPPANTQDTTEAQTESAILSASTVVVDESQAEPHLSLNLVEIKTPSQPAPISAPLPRHLKRLNGGILDDRGQKKSNKSLIVFDPLALFRNFTRSLNVPPAPVRHYISYTTTTSTVIGDSSPTYLLEQPTSRPTVQSAVTSVKTSVQPTIVKRKRLPPPRTPPNTPTVQSEPALDTLFDSTTTKPPSLLHPLPFGVGNKKYATDCQVSPGSSSWTSVGIMLREAARDNIPYVEGYLSQSSEDWNSPVYPASPFPEYGDAAKELKDMEWIWDWSSGVPNDMFGDEYVSPGSSGRPYNYAYCYPNYEGCAISQDLMDRCPCPKGTSTRLRNTKVMKVLLVSSSAAQTWATKWLPWILLTNLLSLAIGAGLGLYFGSRCNHRSSLHSSSNLIDYLI